MEKNTAKPVIDYLIITTLEEERDAILGLLPGHEKLSPSSDDVRVYYKADLEYEFPNGEKGRYNIIVLPLLRMGRVSAASATNDAIRKWEPRYVLLVGIAGGIAEAEIGLGDIIVADQVVDYELQKVGTENDEVRWEVYRTEERLLNAIRCFTDKGWTGTINSKRPEKGDPVRWVGPLATGDKVVAKKQFIDQYRNKWPTIIGVEMEAGGVANAVYSTAIKPGFIMIRSVSDFADEEKNSRSIANWRQYACEAAAAYTIGFLRSGPTPKKRTFTEKELKIKMETAKELETQNEFEKAADIEEEVGRCALEDGDNELAKKALLAAVRNLTNYLITYSGRGRALKTAMKRVKTMIDLLDGIGLHGGILDIDRGYVALIDGDGDEAIKFAESAVASAPGDLSIQGQALDIIIKTHWQKGGLEKVVEMEETVIGVISKIADDNITDLGLILSATWLRTLCKAGKPINDGLDGFISLSEMILTDEPLYTRRVIHIMGEVAGELARTGDVESALTLCKYICELNKNDPSVTIGINAALQTAELFAQLGDRDGAEKYFRSANSYWGKLRTEQIDVGRGNWESLNCVRLFTRGRIFARLANNRGFVGEETEEILVTAMEALLEAISFAVENRAHITGDVGLFLAEVNYWLGGVYFHLGLFDDAVTSFQSTQSESVNANPSIYEGLILPARFDEGRASVMKGDINKASSIFEEIVEDKLAPRKLKFDAKEGLEYLEERLMPLVDWFKSDESWKIADVTKGNSLRSAVAEQAAPLVAWWQEWYEEGKGPTSELFDFWGRGGFARVAAAVRAKPHAAITTDAYDIADIERAARIFCPLFDTVIVKWKGEISSGLVLTPIHEEYGGINAFGGHGYAICSDNLSHPGWHPAVAWANPLPQETSVFLATEALSLIENGRLVVVPAPLAGCSQKAVGWTDNLLVDGFLNGVACAVRKRPGWSADCNIAGQRVVALNEIQFPFVDNISLNVLSEILSEIDDWLSPLRSLFFDSLCGEDLKYERWSKVAALENDIQSACSELKERLGGFVKRYSNGTWRVSESSGSFSGASRGRHMLGGEPVTALLRSIVGERHGLSPWVPYWCLLESGGFLNWTHLIDNPSITPSPVATVRLGCDSGPSDVTHSWLYPGTAGFGFATALAPDL